MLQEFIQKIKRKETPGYQKMYSFADSILRFNMPGFLSPFYRFLFMERQARIHFFRQMATIVYYEPMFRAKCKKVGTGFKYVKLNQNFPHFSGNLLIIFGNRITVHSRSTFSGGKIYSSPKFEVGNGTYLGPGFSVGVAKRVSIGSSCYIADNVTIADNDGHPLDPFCRGKGDPVDNNDILPVQIGNNVWIGDGSIVLKGVSIGESSVVGARSVVVRDVKPYSVVAGNPATIIKRIESDEKNRYRLLK
jgi:acetyltransferase-like isoleucine patch superfamily enzyme